MPDTTPTEPTKLRVLQPDETQGSPEHRSGKADTADRGLRNSCKFAVFDIDGTLIRWQMFHAIVGALVRNGDLPASVGDQIKHDRMAWKTRSAGKESFRAYEVSLLKAYLDAVKGLSTAAHDKAIQEVFDEYKDQVYTYPRQRILDLKAAGYTLIAISGSQQEMIDLIARHYGFDLAYGARFERAAGSLTGEHFTPVFDKYQVLAQAVADHNLSYKGSFAIGDSESDIPILSAVEQPIAFNPSQGLSDHAKAQGWPIVIERKNVIYSLNRSSDGSYVLA